MDEQEHVEVEQDYSPVEEVVETEAPAVEQPQESDKEMNFRLLREERDRDRAEKEEYRKMMVDMQKQMMNSNYQAQAPQQQAPVEQDEFADLDESDWATIEQTRRLSRKEADARFDLKWKEAKEKEEAEAKKKYAEEAPNRVYAKYPDFDSVVNPDSIEQLKKEEPEIFKAFGLINDVEAQGIASYKYIKKFLPDAKENEIAKQRIQQNANKPKTLGAVSGGSPLSQAGAFENGLTPALQKQLWAEMNAASRQG